MSMLQLITLFLPTAFAMHVIIDPGHGGTDHGTSKSNLVESQTTLDVAIRLAAKLKKQRGMKVTLTRATNKNVSLHERAKIARDAHADLLVSIHVNSSPDPKAKGAEFYFQNQLAPDEEAMLQAHRENSEDAQALQNVPYAAISEVSGPVKAILQDLLDSDRVSQSAELCKHLKRHWKGHHKHVENSLYQAPFVVVSEPQVPASLVEIGFVSNEEDFNALNDDHYLDLIAQSLFDGIMAYKESVDKQSPTTLKSPN